jgi:hypothetical protein
VHLASQQDLTVRAMRAFLYLKDTILWVLEFLMIHRESKSDHTPSEVSENVTSTKQTYSEVIKTVLQTNGLSADTIELPDNVPEQYCNLARVFLKVHANLLPEQRPYDCPINLKDDTIPPFKPLYNLTQPEMKALHTYIQENLEKGFIQSSCSPAGAPIFFVPKKDSELRPCVDYCGLNEITIKNRCSLPASFAG